MDGAPTSDMRAALVLFLLGCGPGATSEIRPSAHQPSVSSPPSVPAAVASVADFRLVGSQPLPAPLRSHRGVEVDESSALVHGVRASDGTPYAVEVDADSVSGAPSRDAYQFIRCGAERWVLRRQEGESPGAVSVRWTVSTWEGDAAQTREHAPGEARPPQLRCGGRALLWAWVQGESFHMERFSRGEHTRVVELDVGPNASIDWVPVDARRWVALVREPTLILRSYDGDRRVQERLLENSGGDFALGVSARRFLLGRSVNGEMRLESFELESLSTHTSSTIEPLEPGRMAHVAEMWVGPRGMVAVGVIEAWLGDDVVVDTSEHGPDRLEPSHHSAASVHFWEPASGRVGAAIDLGASGLGSGAWIDDEFVMVLPAWNTGGQALRFRGVP